MSRRPGGRLPRPARLGLYAFLATAALLFLLPLYVMVATSSSRWRRSAWATCSRCR